jgi:hypothetical protein
LTTAGKAVTNASIGVVNISGGSILTTAGRAVCNDSTGTINISGGTISTNTGVAVSNYSTGTINISGGIISATTGIAVGNDSTGVIDFSGGIAFAYGITIAHVLSGTYTQISNAVIAAWNNGAGVTTYTAGTSNDIFKIPVTAKTVWAKQNGEGGISITYGTTTGFIPIAVVKVEGETSIATAETNRYLSVYPNPTTGKIVVSGQLLVVSVEIYDVVGKKLLSFQLSTLDSNEIDISHLANGMYFLKVDGKVYKVVKQ